MSTRTALRRPAAADLLNPWFASTERRQAPSALACDQSFQSRSHYGRLLRNAAKPSRFLQQPVVNIQGRSDMHEYAL